MRCAIGGPRTYHPPAPTGPQASSWHVARLLCGTPACHWSAWWPWPDAGKQPLGGELCELCGSLGACVAIGSLRLVKVDRSLQSKISTALDSFYVPQFCLSEMAFRLLLPNLACTEAKCSAFCTSAGCTFAFCTRASYIHLHIQACVRLRSNWNA